MIAAKSVSEHSAPRELARPQGIALRASRIPELVQVIPPLLAPPVASVLTIAEFSRVAPLQVVKRATTAATAVNFLLKTSRLVPIDCLLRGGMYYVLNDDYHNSGAFGGAT